MKQTNHIDWQEYLRVLDCLIADARLATANVERSQRAWRNTLLWALLGHTAYRISDVIWMNWGFLIKADKIKVIEKKTRWLSKPAREVQFGPRIKAILEEAYCCTNPYMDNDRPVIRSFEAKMQTRGARDDKGKVRYITRRGANIVLKEIAKKYGVPNWQDIAAHSLRKTFARHVYEMQGADHDALVMTAKILGHSNPNTTLAYIGVTSERIANIYHSL